MFNQPEALLNASPLIFSSGKHSVLHELGDINLTNNATAVALEALSSARRVHFTCLFTPLVPLDLD